MKVSSLFIHHSSLFFFLHSVIIFLHRYFAFVLPCDTNNTYGNGYEQKEGGEPVSGIGDGVEPVVQLGHTEETEHDKNALHQHSSYHL